MHDDPGYILNYGFLINKGTINVYFGNGAIYNSPIGTVLNFGIINNGGDINNVGTVNNICTGSINPEASVSHVNQIPCPVSATPNKDSTITQLSGGTNFGRNETLLVSSGGINRVLVSFDLTPYETKQVSNATLRLYITANGNSWGGVNENRAIESHKLLSDWTEGNGSSKTNRGSGLGVTWNCSTDTNISNQATNCSPTWNGGTFSDITDSKVVKNGMVNQWIEFNVTNDVNSFLDGNPNNNFGWIIKKSNETNSGLIGFASKENSDSSHTPQLVLTFK